MAIYVPALGGDGGNKPRPQTPISKGHTAVLSTPVWGSREGWEGAGRGLALSLGAS